MPFPLLFPLSCELGPWDLASLQDPPDDVVGVFPPLSPPVVVVGDGLVPCVEGECRRNGTRNALIPATMSAAAPSLRLLGMFILFPIPLLGGRVPRESILFNELNSKEPVNM